MPTWNTIALFLVTTSVLVITPGPVVMYIVACSIDRGRWVGSISNAANEVEIVDYDPEAGALVGG